MDAPWDIIENCLALHEEACQKFDVSLERAAHFIRLALRSMYAEPAETLEMLEQIRDIGLLAHLEEQLRSLEEVQPVLRSLAETDSVTRPCARYRAVASEYERLIARAEAQCERMDDITAALKLDEEANGTSTPLH